MDKENVNYKESHHELQIEETTKSVNMDSDEKRVPGVEETNRINCHSQILKMPQID